MGFEELEQEGRARSITHQEKWKIFNRENNSCRNFPV
jgi:hypothetical protein